MNSTGLPTTATDVNTGKLIDEWLLSPFSGSATVQTFTVVDADTHQDLMTLTAGAVVDPAKLGTTNLTIRANLSSAQGSVVMQLDTGATNTKTKPPYTASGTDANPWAVLPLTTGAHTITADPQFGPPVSVSFTVAGGTSRVIAGYRADYNANAPKRGWNYVWNIVGGFSSPANHRTLNFRVATPSPNYTVNGLADYPDFSAGMSRWAALNPTGGHPGGGTLNGEPYDHYVAAAYTVKLAGYYGVGSGTVTIASAASNGGRVIIYVETNNGATFTSKLSTGFAPVNPFPFSANVGLLQPGDAIYVGFGPNGNYSNDAFTHDFNIVFKETGNPL